MQIVTPNILFLKNQKDQIKRERLWKNATDRTSMTKRKIIKYPAAWKEKQKRFKEATEYDITVLSLLSLLFLTLSHPLFLSPLFSSSLISPLIFPANVGLEFFSQRDNSVSTFTKLGKMIYKINLSG